MAASGTAAAFAPGPHKTTASIGKRSSHGISPETEELNGCCAKKVGGSCGCGNILWATLIPSFSACDECLNKAAKYLRDISWETEVWVAESPEHVIHFDGERFLGPYEHSAGMR